MHGGHCCGQPRGGSVNKILGARAASLTATSTTERPRDRFAYHLGVVLFARRKASPARISIDEVGRIKYASVRRNNEPCREKIRRRPGRCRVNAKIRPREKRSVVFQLEHDLQQVGTVVTEVVTDFPMMSVD